ILQVQIRRMEAANARFGSKADMSVHQSTYALPPRATARCNYGGLLSVKKALKRSDPDASVLLGRPLDPGVDLTTKRPKIDRLGEKRFSAAFQRFRFRFCITIGGDHDDWHVRSCSFRFRQQFKATHPRHIDIGENQDD